MEARSSHDVVIYGSTSGAVAAAIQGSKLGRSVALVSPQDHIGGIQVNGLGSSDIDNQAEFQNSTTLGGLNLEFHHRISKHYGREDRLNEVVAKRLKDPDVWKFESKVAEHVIESWLQEQTGLTTIKGRLSEDQGVARERETVKSIRLSDGQIVQGKVFVDASYEGDLLAAAGISTTRGRESRDVYGESLAGVRDTTPYRQINVHVDPYITPEDASSGLIYGISAESFGVPGSGDAHLQAYSYRLPLTDDPANRAPITQPADFDPSMFELHRRFFRAGGEHFIPRKRVPRDKTDLIGSEAPLALDLLGMNDSWPTGTYEERQKILKETKRFTKGLIWFYANDESVPEMYRTEWSKLGYCLDEFPDNDHFPYELYVRDARRMVSDYVITEHTATQEEYGGLPQVDDPIAIAFWPTDTHSVRRILRNGKVHNEGFIFKDGHHWRPFGVSYRALVPKRSEARNLLTVTCPSSSHVGFGAIRLEHQFHAIGQAVGNACDIALQEQVDVQDVPYAHLAARLKDQGVILDAETVGKPQLGL